MHIKCENNLFAQAIFLIQKNISAVNSFMENLIKITTDHTKNHILIEATDYLNSLRINLPAEIIENGEIILSSKYLSDIIKKNNERYINIKKAEDDKTVTISYSNAIFNILSIDEEIPFIKTLVSQNKAAIKIKILRKLIDKTIFACLEDEHKTVLNGAFLKKENNTLSMSASDNFTLAYVYEKIDKESIETENKTTINDNFSLIIPKKTLNEILAILNFINDEEKKVTIYWVNTQIALSFDNLYFLSSIFNGKYPDMEKKFINDYEIKIKIKTKELLFAAERVALLADTKRKVNIAKIDIEDSILRIDSNNPDIGMVNDHLNCDLSGGNIKLLINPLYLINILKRIDDENLFIGIDSNTTPILLKPMADDSYKYLLPPIRPR